VIGDGGGEGARVTGTRGPDDPEVHVHRHELVLDGHQVEMG
jgi:hypothetical protein